MKRLIFTRTDWQTIFNGKFKLNQKWKLWNDWFSHELIDKQFLTKNLNSIRFENYETIDFHTNW